MGSTAQILSASIIFFFGAMGFLCFCRSGVSGSEKEKSPRTLVDPSVKYPLPLIAKEAISHDTRKFRFGLPSPDHVLGLPVGQHIALSATINEELIVRYYTPVTSDDTRGHMDLIIKIYFKGVHPKFPDGGKMSQYLESLNIGDTVDVKGPSGRLKYHGNGKFEIKGSGSDPPSTIMAEKLVMIAGGTGITPMLQLIRYITQSPEDLTKMSLLYAAQTEDEILMRDELEEFVKLYPLQLQIWYTVDRSPRDWNYSTGFITADMIKEHLLPPSSDTLVLMCGPPPMIKFACTPNLDTLGYDPKMRFSY